MIELELLGGNGDRIVMTDEDGQRYSIIVDDALRAAVRRAGPAALSPAPDVPSSNGNLRPRALQSLMRAGASAEEVAQSTGMDVNHVRRFEGPVLAERRWAVEQAQACRIGWEKDSPVLGELVIDRLATRGVEPSSLAWDASREGRDPWQVNLTFVQGAEEKHASWVLDLAARSVSALDDESRWLTEAAGQRLPEVFDQDSGARTASAGPRHLAPPPGEGDPDDPDDPDDPERALIEDSSTDALLADLASNRGRRVEVEIPLEDEDLEQLAGAGSPAEPAPRTSPRGQAQVVSMSERRRAFVRPVGARRGRAVASAPSAPSPAPATDADAQAAPPGAENPDSEAPARTSQTPTVSELPPRRHRRRPVPTWDEIVFGARPE